MVVLVIKHVGIPSIELEGQPPIPANPDPPSSFRGTLETVKAIARDSHVVDRLGRIKGGQLQSNSFRMFGLYVGGFSGLEESF